MPETPPASGDAPPRSGLVKRLALPLLFLVTGVAAGVGGAIFVPPLLPAAENPDKAPTPRHAPLEYVEIDNSFTANLKDTGRFVQVRVAISTQGGQPVVDAVERHRIAIIAAVLAILADTGEEELAAPDGRDRLTRRMRVSINDVLQRKSGIAGVDDVFLTSYVVQ